MMMNVDGTEMTSEEKLKIATEHHADLLDLVETKVMPELNDLVDLLQTAKPCRQYQLALMDIESIRLHLNDLKENGPKTLLEQIPLEASEIAEESNVFPLVQPETQEPTHV